MIIPQNKIYIIVKDGVVQDVYSKTKDLDYVVVDLDTLQNELSPEELMEECKQKVFSVDSIPWKDEGNFIANLIEENT